MRIVGFPEEADAEGCIFPVTLMDVVFRGTPEELRVVGEFLINAAAELDVARSSNPELYLSVHLGNSNPHAQVGLSVNAGLE
ncbi:hypothetical protein [Noviherbaspirillum suwonense]|uniref:hypothetical protein n=1 Tax=Noviherbaspirillum suwonense TaxID=1224511 RepID=UPI0024B67FF3|nr:hypothetical protein [Noviherbaspirillum suwonense]